jgi:hypothetical protein
MKTKRTITIATVLVALAALMTFGAWRGMRTAKAQDQQPPPIGDRISFGMVGITQGQTIRLSVVNTAPPPIGDSQPQTYRVVLTFLDVDGHRLRSRDGSIVRRAVDLEPGKATFLDLNADDIQWPPGPIRLQLRAVVNAIPPPIGDSNEIPPPVGERIVTSVEVFNNANGRTAFIMSAPPSVQKLQPPPVGE